MKVAETTIWLPFASVVVYVYGVGPPGDKGVVPGWPTGPCWAWVWRAAVAVGVVAAEAAEVAEVAGVVAAPGAKVCLENHAA
jgi:hypothetical protein